MVCIAGAPGLEQLAGCVPGDSDDADVVPLALCRAPLVHRSSLALTSGIL